MRKIIILGFVFVILSFTLNFYVTDYYCLGDDQCIYKIGDGVTENLLYLSLVYLVASLVSLIAQKNKYWIIVFVIMSFFVFATDQTCSNTPCFNREILLLVTSGVTLLVALITNLLSKFRKK